MIKRGLFLAIFLIFLSFACIGFVSANFVCGTVVKTDNYSDISPSWVNVQVYYSEKPTLFTYCQVSPVDNKYCCNPRDIQNVTWAVGKTVNAFINETGYVPQNVSKVISGGGYDVFPDLSFEKILYLSEPNASIYLNISSLTVKAKSASRYDHISYILKKNGSVDSEGTVCTSCNSADFVLTNLSNGEYNLFVKTYNSNEEYTQNTNFTVLSYLIFQRKIDCTGCRGNRVPSTTDRVNVTIIMNSSYPIKGSLQDIFPADWIYEGLENIQQYSESHNTLIWDIYGSNVMKTYSLIPPKNTFNSKYVFQSLFGSTYSSEEVISLSKFWLLDFIGLKKVYLKNIRPTDVVSNLKVTEDNPVVIYPKDLEVTQVAIFPNLPAFNVVSFVKKTNGIGLDNSKYNFMIWSSLNETNINKIFIEFSINKKVIKKNQNVSFHYYDLNEDSWMDIHLSVAGENKTQITYQTFTNKTGGYSVVIS